MSKTGERVLFFKEVNMNIVYHYLVSLSLSLVMVFSLPATTPQRAIVIGASSGMGAKLVELLAAQGYLVGMAARRLENLQQIQQKIPSRTYIMQMDIAQHQEAVEKLSDLITMMGGLDLLILAGLAHGMPTLKAIIGKTHDQFWMLMLLDFMH